MRYCIFYGIDARKNLFISSKNQPDRSTHRALDKASEMQKGDSKIGSTLRMAPVYG